MTTPLTSVRVALGARSYDIHIGVGLIDRLDALVQPHLPSGAVLVTDARVAQLYGARVRTLLAAAGTELKAFIAVEPGEAAKSLASYGAVIEQVLAAGIERRDTVIALGGGVVGDLAGFVAATALRGIGFVQIPTTLLAQIDSSVGGKTAVNSVAGKNLIGAFYQPAAVIADLDVLDTLPQRELLAGYAEMVKYGLIDNADFFAWLEAHGVDLLAGDTALRAEAVAICCRAKAAIVGADEREAGQRALLNLGHTFGHGLEAAAGYDGSLLHGEAVAAGMVMALDLWARLAGTAPHARDRLIAHFQRVGLPWHSAGDTLRRPAPDADMLIRLMGHDKKAEAGRLVFIAGDIGAAEICRDVPLAAVRDTLQAARRGYGLLEASAS